MENQAPQINTNQQVICIPKSRLVYILLGIFFGELGIHDFYAGYAGKGLMKLLLSLVGTALIVVGFMGAFAVGIGAAASADKEIALAAPAAFLIPLFGFIILGSIAFYVLYQLFTVKKDARGIDFS